MVVISCQKSAATSGPSHGADSCNVAGSVSCLNWPIYVSVVMPSPLLSSPWIACWLMIPPVMQQSRGSYASLHSWDAVAKPCEPISGLQRPCTRNTRSHHYQRHALFTMLCVVGATIL